MHTICNTIDVQGGAEMDMNIIFPVGPKEDVHILPRERIQEDTDRLLTDFAADYRKMAE